MRTLTIVFALISINGFCQEKVRLYFTITENDTTTVTVFEISKNKIDPSHFEFEPVPDVIIPIRQEEYLLNLDTNKYYVVEFYGHNSKIIKVAYILTDRKVSEFPLNLKIDFNDNLALSIRYSKIKKAYESTLYKMAE